MKERYPTPDMPEGEVGFTTRCVVIPDMPEFIALIGGLLYPATKPYFWTEIGTMTVEQATVLMQDALGQYDAENTCGAYMTCEQIIECIENDPDTATALTNWLTSQGYAPTGDEGTYDDPSGYNSNPTILDPAQIEDCDPDILFGMVTQLIQAVGDQIASFFALLEAESNGFERTAIIAEAIPGSDQAGFDTAAAGFDQVLEEIAENFDANYTPELQDEYECDIFCLLKDNCDLDFQALADYFMGRVGAIITAENFGDAVGWFIAGTWIGSEISDAAFALVFTAMSYSMEVMNMDIQWLIRGVAGSLNDPDSDWLTQCDECGGDFPDLITTRCQDALNLGTLTQIDANHWHVVSEVHSDTNSYAFLRDSSVSAGATFKILAITNITHASGFENGSQTHATCQLTNIFSWDPGMIGALNKYEYMFSSDVAFSFDIEVSVIGA